MMPIKDIQKRRQYHKNYMIKWYSKNKQKCVDSVARIHIKYHKWWREYRDTLSCMKCGENHPATIDFHHRNPTVKEFNIGDGISGHFAKKRIMAEILKCDILCANCHRKLHYNSKRGE